MTFIIIDTSTPYYLCIIASDQAIQFSHLEKYPSKEAADLFLTQIFQGLDGLGMGVADLAAIIVTNGPGSLIALRTGLSIAQAMACAHQLPVYVVGSMALYACAMRKPVFMDARCGHFYYYKDFSRQYPDMYPASDIALVQHDCLVAGDCSFDIESQQVLDVKNIAQLHRAAFELIKSIKPVLASEVSGFYLKPAVSE
jgi:tRNA A37 threonylcarbamoyladenosine modification protein TsaB